MRPCRALTRARLRAHRFALVCSLTNTLKLFFVRLRLHKRIVDHLYELIAAQRIGCLTGVKLQRSIQHAAHQRLIPVHLRRFFGFTAFAVLPLRVLRHLTRCLVFAFRVVRALGLEFLLLGRSRACRPARCCDSSTRLDCSLRSVPVSSRRRKFNSSMVRSRSRRRESSSPSRKVKT